MSRMSPGVLAPPHELLTPQEWQQRGRERREAAPLLSHGQWEPPPDRPDPVDILEEQARARVPELVPIRYGRMAASPFAHFRGAAGPMAWDLAHTPTSGIRVQACGDAHLLNFGMFAAPDRRLVFDVNDFDETLPAPFEWDVKRLAASFSVAARGQGFGDRDAHTAARLAVRSYRTEMLFYASMRFLKVWYMKGSISVSLMDPHQLAYYGRFCGWALARAHARTGRASMISGYLGEGEDFDQAIADFAIAYAGQNERDYQQLRRAISDARILATVEP